MEDTNIQLKEVLQFWFEELSSDDWFSGDQVIDEKIKDRFSVLHKEVAANEYWKYRNTPESFLAEVIVLDQFSRNVYRDNADSFAYDGQALALTQQAILAGFDTSLPKEQRAFLYMPFMHSESKTIHQEALRLFESLESEIHLKYEKVHKDIIDRFGRYPHRNEVLGRKSTPEEVEYLQSNNEDFF